MLQIPIQRITKSFYASPGQFAHEPALGVVAVRWQVFLSFGTELGVDPFEHQAILDTGAPFNVVPHQFCTKMRWDHFGRQLTERQMSTGHQPQTMKVDWENIICEVGRAYARVIDPTDTAVGSKICTFVGKFATVPYHEQKRDRKILLGANFLLDNNAQLVLNAAGRPFDYLQFND